MNSSRLDYIYFLKFLYFSHEIANDEAYSYPSYKTNTRRPAMQSKAKIKTCVIREGGVKIRS